MSDVYHKCIEIKGTNHECQECPVFLKGERFCKIMADVLTISRIKNLIGVQVEDVQDILSNTVIAIRNGIEKFKGHEDVQFSFWVKMIFRNKRADYFRSQYASWQPQPFEDSKAEESHESGHSTSEDDLFDHNSETEERDLHDRSEVMYKRRFVNYEDSENKTGSISEIEAINSKIDAEKLLVVLKKMIFNDKTGCIKFMLDDYLIGLQQGWSHKEMAENAGIGQNNFNQRLKRCKERIREMLNENNYEFGNN